MNERRFVYILLFISNIALSQVGIGTNTPEAVMDIVSTDNGILIPRISDTLQITFPKNGMLIYETRKNSFAFYKINKWVYLSDDSTTSTGPSTSSDSAIKINVNQSNFLTLSGTQTYGRMLLNSSITLSPSYVTGVYPDGQSSTDNIIRSTDLNGSEAGLRGCIFENSENFQANFYRINSTVKLSSSQLTETSFFIVKVISNSSGAIVFNNTVTIPKSLNVGQEIQFQTLFATIADSNSIGNESGKGYRIQFETLGNEISGNLQIRIDDIVRITN